MKKRVSIVFIILSAALILDTFNAGHAFIMFFFLGVIPGSNATLDAVFMLNTYAGIAGFIAARAGVRVFASAFSSLPAPVVRRSARAAN